MKTLITLAIGSFLPSIASNIAMHPGAFDMALGILFGLIAGLLLAVVMVKPSRHHAPMLATGSKPTKRTAHRPARRVQPSYAFTPVNYEWSAA